MATVLAVVKQLPSRTDDTMTSDLPVSGVRGAGLEDLLAQVDQTRDTWAASGAFSAQLLSGSPLLEANAQVF